MGRDLLRGMQRKKRYIDGRGGFGVEVVGRKRRWNGIYIGLMLAMSEKGWLALLGMGMMQGILEEKV